MGQFVGTEPKGVLPLFYAATSSHLSHFRPASRGWSTSGSTSRRSPSTTVTTITATRKRTQRRWTRDGWRRLFWIWPPASVTRHWNKSSQKISKGAIAIFLSLKGPTPASFCLFSFFSNTSFIKNCRLQQDLNSDRQSIRRARWPLSFLIAQKWYQNFWVIL